MPDYYMSPRWTAEIMDCSLPLTFDQYSNCSYGCLYCFSQFQRGVGTGKDAYQAKQVRCVSVDKVKRIFRQPHLSPFFSFIREKRPIQWGGLSDPFCMFEKKFGVGLDLLRFFRSMDYPISFSTKGTWWVDDPRYSELFKDNPKWHVKFSIITMDEKKAARMEKGVNSPKERLRAINTFSKLDGGEATLRLRPFIIGFTDPTHTELIHAAASMGAKSVSTEFFCYETRSKMFTHKMEQFNELCGMDVSQFYRENSHGSGYLRLNRELKRPFIEEMRSTAYEAGMRFYVSDVHFKEICDNGSCCGLPESWNYSRGQFTEALMIARKKGMVSWKDIAPHANYLKGVDSVTAPGCQIVRSSPERSSFFKDMSMYEVMRWYWNHPNAPTSPYRAYGGVIRPKSLDDEGNVVYEWYGGDYDSGT